jgi:hypothetical protein
MAITIRKTSAPTEKPAVFSALASDAGGGSLGLSNRWIDVRQTNFAATGLSFYLFASADHLWRAHAARTFAKNFPASVFNLLLSVESS